MKVHWYSWIFIEFHGFLLIFIYLLMIFVIDAAERARSTVARSLSAALDAQNFSCTAPSGVYASYVRQGGQLAAYSLAAYSFHDQDIEGKYKDHILWILSHQIKTSLYGKIAVF